MKSQTEDTKMTTPEIQLTAQENELAYLKNTAKRLGVDFPINANIAKMRALIDEKLSGVKEEEPEVVHTTLDGKRDAQTKRRIKDIAHRLVRFRIAVLDPSKQKWTGEYFTAGNEIIGHKTRFIPYDAEDGVWHAEAVIVELLRNHKYQSFPQVTDRSDKRRGTDDYHRAKLLPSFSITELPPLTKEELEDLRERQAAQGSID